MKQVRTVLGDVPAGALGVTYAHEHLVLDSPLVEDRFADILLNDADAAVAELESCAAAGVTTVVDALPCAAGRHPLRLAEISRRSGVHIIATTGLHTRRWYPGSSWTADFYPGTLAWLFIADIEEGIDLFDYTSPITDRTPHRAGVIKVATMQEQLDDGDRRVFAAVAETHETTGAPILTHCEEGRGGLEQIAALTELGVEPEHIVLSHTDKVTDPAYHADLAGTGAYLEYDQALRHPLDDANPTVALIESMLEAGLAERLMLGTDGARRSMWTSLGGSPGLAALANDVVALLVRRGVDRAAIDRMLIENPASFFAFVESPT